MILKIENYKHENKQCLIVFRIVFAYSLKTYANKLTHALLMTQILLKILKYLELITAL
jgi:hypothetical protein